MPTPIKVNTKTDQKQELREGVKRVLRLVKLQHEWQFVSYADLVRTVWSQEELDHVEALRVKLGSVAFRNNSVECIGRVLLDHPALPYPATVDLSYKINHSRAEAAKPWPREWLSADGDVHIETAQQILGDTYQKLAYQAMDYYCIRQTLSHLTGCCDTYEQALYMFPHYRTVLKKSAIPASLRDIEVTRAPGKLPTTSERTRRMMKHAHTLMAMHTLMGTFDDGRAQTFIATDSCIVTLAGNTEFGLEVAGNHWLYEIGCAD